MSTSALESSSRVAHPVAGSAPPAKKKKSRLGLWVLLVLLVLVIGGAAAAYTRGEKPIEVTVEQAARRTITQLVSATGRVQPVVEVKISPEVSGEILELPFREGQAVRRGDIIARIRPDFYVTQVDQQRAVVLAARAQVLQAQASLRQRELDFRDAERLLRDRVRSEADFRAVQAAYESAQAALKATEADVVRAEAALRQAEDNLSKTTIRAPMDGTVSLRNSEVGDRVVATAQFAGTEMFRIADLSAMEVRVNVNENDIVNVKVGDTARITVDAYQNKVFTGRVRQIANSARTTGAGTQEEVTNFEVRIDFVNADSPLRPGMSASADVETRTVRDVISVPIQAVTVRTRDAAKTVEEVEKDRAKEAAKSQGEGAAEVVNLAQQRQQERTDRANLKRVVFIKRGETVSLVEVTTGVADLSHIEIQSGIQPGDEVVTGSFAAITRRLKEGSRVELEKPKQPADRG